MTTHLINGLWIVISLIGLSYSMWDMGSAYSHYNLVKQGWPDHERLIEFTRMTLSAQASRALLLLIFLALGINAYVSDNSAAFIVLMFAANVITVASSIITHRHRNRMFAKEQEMLAENERHGNRRDLK